MSRIYQPGFVIPDGPQRGPIRNFEVVKLRTASGFSAVCAFSIALKESFSSDGVVVPYLRNVRTTKAADRSTDDE